MLKLIITVLGLMVWMMPLNAETLYADYDVSYGIFGKIGTAKAKLKKSHTRYTIEIRLAATGLAKRLSGNRTERHISTGHIKNGILVSDTYKVIRAYRDIKVVKSYTMDHRRKKVIKVYKKYKADKLVDTEKKQLDFYAFNDLLTLYFNLDRLLPDKNKFGTYIFKAVGAEKQKGKVSIYIPQKHEVASYVSDLGDGAAWYATVIIHQKIFMSKEGRLQIAVGKDGVTQTALLKDLILFGDIRADRVK